jgi:hypothetical protein
VTELLQYGMWLDDELMSPAAATAAAVSSDLDDSDALCF